MPRYWITSREFWMAVAERAAKTFAQGFLALVAGRTFDVFDAAWVTVVGISAGMAVLSVLTSIVSADIGERGTPSLVRGEL